MSFFSEEMMPMLGIYESETAELMDGFDNVIGRVEQEGGFSSEDVDELFRCAHSIKGSSAMMGLETLSELTHRVEDIFDALRQDLTCVQDHLPYLLDHLYAFSDYVHDELARMGDEEFEPASAERLLKDIAGDLSVLRQDGQAPLGEQAADKSDEAGNDPNEAASASALAQEGVTLRVSFKPDVPMVNARAMVIVRQLKAKITILSTVPADFMDADAADRIAADGLLLSLSEEDAQTARTLLAKNSTVNRITTLNEAVSTKGASQKKEEGKKAATAPTEKFVTLRWESLRDLQELAGDFIMSAGRLKEALPSEDLSSELRAAASRMSRLADDLVYRVNAMAMVSVSALIPQLSRMVRDMCRSTGKHVSFVVHGGDIEVDRNLYNSISEPLIHIIRNAVDHGIESSEERLAAGKEARGTVTLTVESLGGRVAFKVSDDGRGMDAERLLDKADQKGILEKPAHEYTREEALRLIMKPGFSTSAEVSQYSGRGVGMDVVNTVVNDFEGRVEVESELGKGTSIALFMPVSTTSVDCLALRVGPVACFMPFSNLDKIYTAQESEDLVVTSEGQSVFTHGKLSVPLLDLHEVTGFSGETGFYVVCHSLDRIFAVCVDEVLGEEYCANKPLPSCMGRNWMRACGIRNGVIRADGTVGYALNAALLARLAYGREKEASGRVIEESSILPTGMPGGLSNELPPALFAFRLGAERYAINLKCVDRIMTLPLYTPIPYAEEDLIGTISHRGRVVPVYDLARSVGVTEQSSYVLVLLGNDEECVGFTITDAEGVRPTDSAMLLEDQPESHKLIGGLRTGAAWQLAPREAPIILMESVDE
ncbi:MAG: chemotaxis protein CheW [Coriobacteriales bacterium]|nr:chemotaxis protein CheW [Coriobacteriales bacterium]